MDSTPAEPRPVDVVAHTHWDREWYAPFEALRARLVQVLDGFLAALEGDPAYSTFLLDGQMAVIDDYLELRPHQASTLKRLAGAGRISMGPWYVLMDEFCVSGETIVRNLQLGLDRAESFGGAMAVGYLPDMFGHIAQMPQILRLAGIEHAVVWRGIPAAIRRTAFWWDAPDGSRVRAEYLPLGYANAAQLPRDPGAFLQRVQALESELAGFIREPTEPMLLMNGSDHQEPQLFLPEMLQEANQAQCRYVFAQTSLQEHLARAPSVGLPSWAGELRSGARANLLRGVLSNRVDVKQAAATAERLLERLAEPLATLWLAPKDYPVDLIERAWLQLIRNSAHDSICACSSDQVGRAVRSRYDDVAALAGEVVRRGLEMASVALPEGALVVNACPHLMSGVIELCLPGSDAPPGTQILHATPAALEERRGTGAEIGRILAGLSSDGWLVHNRGNSVEIRPDDDGLEVRIVVDASEPVSADLAAQMAQAYAEAGARRDRPLRVLVERRESVRVAALASNVPGWGWEAWSPAPLAVEPVCAGESWLDNGLLRVEVNLADGTLAIGGIGGLDRLVDGGDEGDTYTYSPPAHDILVEVPEAVSAEVLERGPVRGRLVVRRRFCWPERIESGKRIGRVRVEVSTVVELVAGQPFVRVSHRFDNPSRDHRLRAVFPLPERADEAVAECAFATVSRRLRSSEGGPGEPAQDTWPSRRFVSAGGLTLTHEGLLEHELIDDGRSLAITLLRATGWLSRPAPAARPNSAGPPVPVEAAQMLGPFHCRYALALGEIDPWRLADEAWQVLPVVRGAGGPLPQKGSRLAVSGVEVSALRRCAGGEIELRLFNPSGEPAAAIIEGCSGWLVDLRGRRLAPFDEQFELGPWQIATARLSRASPDEIAFSP